MTSGGDTKEWAALAVALGTRVTQERTRLNITKEALGERSGLASRYIWRVEAGMQNIQLGNIGKLAKGLGVSLAQLMDGLEHLVENPAPRPPSRRRVSSKKAN
jgi:transcriptional regulator with XRE-family HTH domain